MKKILALFIAFACASGAWADTVLSDISGTDFSTYPVGVFDPEADDSGVLSDTTFWYNGFKDDLDAEIVNISSNAETGATLNYLTFESNVTNPLYRTIYNSKGFVEGETQDIQKKEIGLGLFIDTEVQFTPYLVNENHPAPTKVSDEDKLIVWVRELDLGGLCQTNLIVTAGFIDAFGTVTPSNYVARLTSAEVDALCKGRHRLTIKAFDNIVSGVNGMAGFIVYIDEVAIKYEGDAFGSGAIGGHLLGSLKATPALYYTDEAHLLFPSLMSYGAENSTKITSVGFAGMGQVGEVWFDDYETAYPEFAGDDINFQVVVGDGVTSFEYMGETYTATTQFSVKPGTEFVSVTNVVYADGWSGKANWWFAGNKVINNHGYNDGSDGAVLDLSLGDAFTLAGFKSNYEVTVGGTTASYETLFGSVTETNGALAAAMGGTLKLMGDVTIAEGGFSSITIGEGQSLELDLNGYTLQGTSESDATIKNQGTLTITDTSEGKTGKVLGPIVAGYPTYSAITVYADSNTRIVAGLYEAIREAEGKPLTADMIELLGGTFLDEVQTGVLNEEAMEYPFYMATCYDSSALTLTWDYDSQEFDDGYGGTYEMKYWYATLAAPVGAVNVTVPAAVENATWKVTVGTKEYGISDNTASVPADSEVTLTLVANEGYLFDDGTSEKVVKTETVSEDADWSAIEVPAVVPAKAKIGTVFYLTLNAAIEAAQEDETVTLLDNVTLDSTIIIAGKAITLDMGGRVISAPLTWADNPAAFWVRNGGDLTLTNGTINTTVEGVRLGYKKATVAATAGTLTIASDAVITTSDIGVVIYGGSTLTTSGTITSTSAKYAAVHGNGLDTLTSTITIEGGVVTSAYNHAIYHPQPGTLTVSGGTITGYTGIEMRAGTFSMTGGKVVATGAYTAPEANDNGSTVEGAAIVLSQHVTGIAVDATITGGVIESASGKKLTVANTTAKPVDIDASIAGVVGIQATELDVYIDSLEFNETGDGGWGLDEKAGIAQIGEDIYYSFNDAFAAVADTAGEYTIKLLADCTNTVNAAGDFLGLKSGVNLTIDLNGKTLTEAVDPKSDTIDYGAFYVRKGSSLTITDTSDGAAGKIASNGDVVIGNYGTVIVKAGTIECGDDADLDTSIYNFYYTTDFYGSTTISGGTVGCIWNSGIAEITGGTLGRIDNSGAMDIAAGVNVTGTINAGDGNDCPAVPGKGVITAPDGLNVTTEVEGYEVKYVDGAYVLVEIVTDPWVTDDETDAAAQDKIEDIFGEDSPATSNITTYVEYTNLVQYIKTVKGSEIIPSSLTTNEMTYVVESMKLGAAKLFTAKPKIELTEAQPSTDPNAEAGDWEFKVKVTQGEVDTALEVAKAKVEGLVKIRTDLATGDWAAPADGDVTSEYDGNEISVKIKFGDGKKGFMMIRE